MQSDSSQPYGIRLLLVLAALVVVVAGMRAAAPILVPFLLSVFIAILSAPPLFWLKRKGVPTALALFMVITVIVVAILFVTTLIGNSLADFTRNLPSYQHRLTQTTRGLAPLLEERGIDIPGIEDPGELLTQYINPAAAMRTVVITLSNLGSVLGNAFFILITVIFMLLEASSLPAKLQTMFRDPDQSLGQLTEISESIKRYIVIKTVVSLATGSLVGVWLTLFGVDYAILWGLVAFLLNYVPNIGSIIAAIPGTLMALIQFGPVRALYVALGYLVINVVISNFLEPRVMGRGLGLSTLVVFTSLVFWGWVLGPVGMLLSMPLTVVLKITLEHGENTRWIAILLGPAEPPPSPPPAKKPEKKSPDSADSSEDQQPSS